MASSFKKLLSRPFLKRSLISLFIVYGLFCLILGVIMPLIAKQQLAPLVTETLGRDTQIEDIRFNPFTFELSVERLVVSESKPTNTFIGFEKLYINMSPLASLANLAIIFEQVSITKPTINIERLTADTYNYSDIIALFQSASNPDTQSSENIDKPVQIRITQIAIEQGAVSIKDAVSNSQMVYPEINLAFDHFDTAANMEQPISSIQNQYDLSLTDEYKSQLQLFGHLQLFPFVLEVNVTLSEFNIAKYWQFVDEHFDIQLTQGKLNINSKIILNIDSQQDTPVSFTLADTDININSIIASHANEEKIVIDALNLNGIQVDSTTQQVYIESFQTSSGKVALNISPTGADLIKLLMPKNLTDADIDNGKGSVDLSTEPVSPSWLINLNAVDIANYEINLGESIASDQVVLWQIGQVSFKTGPIKSDLSIPLDYQFSAKINQQSELRTVGIFNLIDQTLNADLSYQNVSLTSLQPYVEKFINITIEDGTFNTKGNLRLDTEKQLNYSGQAWVENLDIKDNLHRKTLVSWQKMSINQLEFDRQQSQINIDEILFDELYSRIIIAKDRSTNISNLLKQQTVTANVDNNDKATELKPNQQIAELNQEDSISPKIAINRITLKNSSAFFADNSLTPNFASGIESLNGQIDQLSNNPQTIASVDLAGKIDKYAPVTLKGEINPLLELPYLDLNLIFKNVELTSVNPYSGTYAGYFIDKGQISLDLNYQLKNNALVGTNHVVINQLQLGKPSNSDLATSLPITLAVALLQDRNGVIDLGVDVEGDLSSPSFSFGSVIWGALGNIISKAVTAPFSLLANLIGSDEPINKVSFDYGNAELNNAQTKHLMTLADALSDRPLLIVNVKGEVDAINDSQALAKQALHLKLATTAQIPVDKLPADLSASQFPLSGPITEALYTIFNQDIAQNSMAIKQSIIDDNAAQYPETPLTENDLNTRWHIVLYNTLKSAHVVAPSELGKLAQLRAKTVKAFLVEQANIEANRVYVVESRVNSKQKLAEVQLELQAN
ncbi:DUF748 domain-containing protein [Shewanella sp. OMA3-2]|uniref:DUF748 domain-containing protein n=1 Tax=Shewanella sp. OMA3-2 TaxID=2908650 RepID=UPI001F1C3D81|nr:DUF748 domain-containing protein [Shewanella sp. OMA3-2]UJF20626.1 DUF748 domain-containing protein [Shewanella sp. OMA3-2]